MTEQPVHAQVDPAGRQVIEITIRGGYRPGSIVARAGLPLRIVFRREDDDACTERVVFSAPRLERRLAPSGTTVVDLPAQPPGEIRFTCGMGRYRGHIDLMDEHNPSIQARLRDRTARVQGLLRSSLGLWIWPRPLTTRHRALAGEHTGPVGGVARCNGQVVPARTSRTTTRST